MASDNNVSACRYEPSGVDLSNRNSAHTLIVELTGFDKTVLEVGCSTGYLTRILKERGNRIIGIEVDPEAASVAAQFCEHILVGDVESLDLSATFAPDSFDVIILGDVLEHLKWPQSVLRKLRPLLKPDGYLVVSLPNVTHGDIILHMLQGRFPYQDVGLLDVTHFRFFGPEDVARMFQETEYEIRQFETTHLEIGATELQVCLDQFPGELINALRKLPHSKTYQFLFTAAKAQGGAAASLKLEKTDVTRYFGEAHMEAVQTLVEQWQLRNQHLQELIDAIQASNGWKALQAYYRVRDRWLPARSKRREQAKRVARRLVTAMKTINRHTKPLRMLLWSLRQMRLSHAEKFARYCRIYGARNAIRLAYRKIRQGDTAPKIEIRPLIVPQVAQIDIEGELPVIDKKVSVVIPTKDAGPEFRLLLQKLKAQKGLRECEIVVVDSGSSDQTVQVAKEEGTKLVEIPPESFSHSYSRNAGAEHASGDYLLFMVQDALPMTDRWLWEMCRAMEQNGVVAVSCAEYPRADSDLFYRLLIWNHYKTLNLDKDRVLAWDESCSSHVGLRSNAQINDVAGLIRADVFKQLKFRRDYAEDLDLGIRLIQGGHKLGFLYSTRVVHSHQRPPFYFLKRAYVDSRFLVDVFADFAYPAISNEQKLHGDIVSLFWRTNYVLAVLPSIPKGQPPKTVFATIRDWFQANDPNLIRKDAGIQDRPLAEFLRNELLAAPGLRFDPLQNSVLPHVLHHTAMMEEYLSGIHSRLDEPILSELAEALYKIVALHSGAHLAYLFLSCRGRNNGASAKLDAVLRSGV
jgi:glycosyltransferase involved in cell wall biosynthesis/2-polyprenyl-3-methyl-5-hydroxy-6-metoxy-1,4-benzoquinol methylase